MFYHFKVHKDKRWFWAEGIELPECLTQGATMEELVFNMAEVLDLVLDEPEDSTRIYPEPRMDLKGRNIARVPVNPKIALAMQVRQARVRRELTQKQAAEKLGMKNVYSYQRLESSKTINPEFSTLLRIRKVFPEVSVDLAMG